MNTGYDLAIVGAGIIGLSHAYAAAKRGLKVAVFERTNTPLGASVCNFGRAIIIGQSPGEMLQLARHSRAFWGELANQAGFSVKKQAPCYLLAQRLKKNF